MKDADWKSHYSRGIDWLTQQADDGGWHSATYGQLKDGAAVTALALYCLGSPAAATVRTTNRQPWIAGNAFLDRGIAKRGTIASPDGYARFPNLCGRTLAGAQRTGSSVPAAMQTKNRRLLARSPSDEARGFEPDSPSYGGWDFFGRAKTRAGSRRGRMSP